MKKESIDKLDEIINHHWNLDNFKDVDKKIDLVYKFFKEYERRLYLTAKELESDGPMNLAWLHLGSSANYKEFKD
jgi:hypothetical protein